MASTTEDKKPFNSEPLPSSAPDPKPNAPPPKPTTRSLRKSVEQIDTFLARLSLVLSTPAGTDSLLRTATYTLQFVSGATSTLVTKHFEAVARTLAEKVSQVPLLPNESLVVALRYPAPAITSLAPRARALSGLISDFRAFTRLWGLLGMYQWGKGLWSGAAAPKDGILLFCAWGQCLAYTAYQILENRAYLAGKGVIGREGKLILRDWLWSSRCWMFAVGLEFVRLNRVRQKWNSVDKKRQQEGVVVSEEAKIKRRQEVVQWRKDLIVNLANSPLTLHWSVDGGTLDDTTVGFLGALAGIFGFSERWSATKAQVSKA
jgi:hypothetical protein